MQSFEPIPIQIRLSLVANNLILEEFPLSEKYIKKVNDNYHLLTTEVGNFLGVGRFVLDLPCEIEVDYPQALKDYLMIYPKILDSNLSLKKTIDFNQVA